MKREREREKERERKRERVRERRERGERERESRVETEVRFDFGVNEKLRKSISPDSPAVQRTEQRASRDQRSEVEYSSVNLLASMRSNWMSKRGIK